MKTILKIDKIKKCYKNGDNITKALNNISFDVKEGEYIGIMGVSGSGKTTLLNCISTIDSVTEGSIKVNDLDITKLKNSQVSKFRRDELGFIFQDFNLLDTLTAYENISLALSISKFPVERVDQTIKEIAKTLNITEILEKYPYEISGGQQQRVAAARAIVTKPSLILADEPTGSLDSNSAQMLLNTLDDLNKKLGATILMVTHDPFTASYCSRILFIKDGKIFKEISRENKDRRDFFANILDVVSDLGGEKNNVF